MAIVAPCPNCDFPTNLPDDFRGDRVRCLNCNTIFPVGILRKPANPPPLVGSPKPSLPPGALPVGHLIGQDEPSGPGPRSAQSLRKRADKIPLELELIPVADPLPAIDEAYTSPEERARRHLPIIIGAAGAACLVSLLGLVAFLTWGVPAVKGNKDAAVDTKEVVDHQKSGTGGDEETEKKKDLDRETSKAVGEAPTTNQKIVPLPDHKAGAANRSNSEWADARASAVHLGGVRVQIISLRVEGGQFRMRLLLESVGTTEVIAFQGWGAEVANRPHLIDGAGHSIEGGSGLDKAPRELRPC